MEKYLLGVDVGTTGTKAMLFSENGKVISHAYKGYSLSTPSIGLSEQNAEDWYDAVVETIRKVCCDEKIKNNVLAISLSTQGGTLVPTDGDFNPLRPAIVWNDSRCEKQKEDFITEVGGDDFMYNTCGWHLGNKLPALTIRWIKENEPEIFDATKYFLTVPDYISAKLTGRPAVDLSNAGINQLCDIKTHTYNSKILNFCNVDTKKLPELVPSGKKIGNLTSDAAKELGLSTDTVLVSGAHDQYAVALGAGATKAGDMLIGSGTCWVVTAIGKEPDFASGLSQSVAATPGMWGSLQSLSSGGVCLDWLRKNIIKEEISYKTIDEITATKKAAEEGLYFYPFSGKCCDKKRFKKASFVGMDLSHDCFSLARAVMEGVVFQILWIMEGFKTKPSKDGIILSGGATKSPVWAQLLADISGLPVKIPEVADLACVGAAIMAGVGCGLFENEESGYKKLAVGEKVLMPDKDKTEIYSALFSDYKKIAESIQQ